MVLLLLIGVNDLLILLLNELEFVYVNAIAANELIVLYDLR